MQPAHRTAARSLRRLRPQSHRQPRRNASDSHGSRGSHEHHPTATTESFGSGFYIALAAFPAAFAVYKFTQSGNESSITRYIQNTYEDYSTKWERRNDVHTQAMEQAAADRVLFLNESNQAVRHVDLRFPEQFNNGSPWNVPAGHGYANIDAVIAKYEKEATEANERKLQQLRDNNVPVEKPYEPLTKAVPGTTSV